MVSFDGKTRGKRLLPVIILNLTLVFANNDAAHGDRLSSASKLKCGTKDANGLIKVNKQITVYLSEKETVEYYFENTQNYERSLSLTLTPCSSRLKWSFVYVPTNEIGGGKENIGEGIDNTTRTVTTRKARIGCYTLILTAVEGRTRVNLYLTMDDGGPHELTIPQSSNLNLKPLNMQRLLVTWARSSVNSHNATYCVVASREKQYSVLCSAEIEGEIIDSKKSERKLLFKGLNKIIGRKKGNSTAGQRKRSSKNARIICVKQKLKVVLDKMKKKETYYISLFAINNNTNFTILYGNASIKYNYKTRSIALQNGKRRLVYLKKRGGEVYFRYNIPLKEYKNIKLISFYILVCGGSVQAEFTRKDKKDRIIDWNAANTTRVFGYKRFDFKTPGDYFLKVKPPDVDEQRRVEYIEVYATTNPMNFPLPAIPEKAIVHEYESRRTCNTITVAWVPEPDNTKNKYCVTVRENKRINLADKFRASFQCYLGGDNRKGFSSFPQKLEKKVYVYRKCKEQFTKQGLSVTNHTITNLKPGRSYTIQVTVEKKNGRMLSYKLLKAVTKHSCDT